MNKTLLFACSLLMCASVNATDFETAADAVKNIDVGWNLGNTLDAADASKTWTTTEQHETYWGQPVTKPELMKMMKEAGFGAIRVPVTWLSGNGQQRKSERCLDESNRFCCRRDNLCQQF
ncbi:MAG: cellulase family glycosylhydrolase [Prevotella sp.]|nr:cellulase family glycosylhydrolase [Prevotella sp.]